MSIGDIKREKNGHVQKSETPEATPSTMLEPDRPVSQKKSVARLARTRMGSDSVVHDGVLIVEGVSTNNTFQHFVLYPWVQFSSSTVLYSGYISLVHTPAESRKGTVFTRGNSMDKSQRAFVARSPGAPRTCRIYLPFMTINW